MPWSVEIHHIFLGGAGDSTLIRARHPAVGANAAVDRTVLIDGGRLAGGTRVHNYLNSLAAPPATINVIAVTHFDEDHYYGIIKLLRMAAPVVRYANAIIYDCGQLPAARLTRIKQDAYGNDNPVASMYAEYRGLAVARNRTHATRTVNSYHIAQYDINDAPQLPAAVPGIRQPTWLLGKDILWGNGAVAWAENPPLWAPNHPTLRCVVANKWVRQAAPAPGPAPAPLFISELDIYDGPRMADPIVDAYENDKDQDNAKSLGFLLEFNNFRYYLAGDLERAQEDGRQTVNAVPPAFHPGVRAFINLGGTAAGRVSAMKTSHHGAATASSRQFLTALRPSAAFISNGARNRHWHPFRQTINSLDGYPELPANRNAQNVHGGAPPPPPLPPITNYLTGYQNYGAALLTLGGVVSQTAGPPGNHVRLNVTEDQSQRDRRGQVYRGVNAALTQFNAAAAVGMTVAQIDTLADFAVLGAAGTCGVALGTTVAVAYAGTTVALYGGDTLNAAGGVVPGAISLGIAAAGGGAAAVAAAIGAVGHGQVNAALPGATAVLGEVVTGAAAANIIAVGNAAAPANPNGVNAAAIAATTVSAAGLGVAAAAYAAMAAMGAGGAGAPVGAAAAIGAVVGAQAGGANAALTVNVVRAAAAAAGVGANNASVAGLVAGVAAHSGTPANVFAATNATLNAHGIAPGLVPAAAQAAATIPDTTLFTVTFTTGAGAGAVAQNINHSG